jgi:CubicO group peptidase (beta-lactamase class C family)
MYRAISIALAAVAACCGQSAAPDLTRMDQVAQAYVNNGSFMGAVLVARGHQVLFSKGYGSANLEWNIPNTPDAKFRLGSLTKQFTAASILLLEERGKLKVEDLVKKYLPDSPAAWDKITIFHLLTHTSGIPNFTSFPDYREKEALPATPEELVARFRDKPLDFQPGERWNYSNSGYVLLGYLLEKITGESYAKFVQEDIFVPLGMKDSGYDSNSAIILRRAAGYTSGPGGPRNAGYIDMSIPFSAGALYSTTEDLLRWEQGLFGGKLLSAASLAKMTTPFKNDYAFGLTVTMQDGHKRIEHNGGIEGFNTVLAYYPDDKLTVIVLSNINGQAPDDMYPKLATVAFGGQVTLPSERKEVSVAPSVLSGYVGSYSLTPMANMAITLEDGKLVSQVAGQPKVALFAESPTRFFTKIVDAELDFGRDDKGAYLILHQGGRDLKAYRLAHRTEIAVSPAILAQYAGVYELGPGFNLTVTLEDGHLMGQGTGQPKFEMYAESETKFFLKTADAQIDFERNAQGVATALVLHQAGRDMRAPKK